MNQIPTIQGVIKKKISKLIFIKETRVSSYVPIEKGDPASPNQCKNSSSKVSVKMGPTEETPGISHH